MKNIRGHLTILLAAFLWGTVALFSGLLTKEHVDVFSQIFYRLLFGFVITAVIARIVFKQNLTINKKELKYLLWNSFFTLGGWTFFMISIYLGTPIAKAIALIYSYPLYIVILSYILLKDLPSFKNWVGIILSILSVGILLEVWKIQNILQISAGDWFALIDAIFTAAVVVYGRKMRLETKINSAKSFTYTLFFMFPQLFFFGFLLQAFGIDMLRPVINIHLSLPAWFYAVGIGAFGTAFTFPLLYVGLSRVKAHVASILLLFEPVTVYMFGIIFFGQYLNLWGIVGMLGIVVSTLFI